ncbi:hypothetical protein RDWZM_002983 [Blomia tropicalis]|uniref:CCR4-NOT transcription complex subunit 9 n=1 Tax=Blomia tropicalis TaxID=40697 RepID=A0A9Q0RQE6_BLOTA|nr:hypothetical protein RDWZM_002983 [Blomia tropicalis]
MTLAQMSAAVHLAQQSPTSSGTMSTGSSSISSIGNGLSNTGRTQSSFVGLINGLGGTGVGSSVATSASSNLPSSTTQATGPAMPVTSGTVENEKIYQCINDLLCAGTREAALMELSRKRESVADLAVMLWHSFGAIAALLQEIIAVYPTIHPPTLNAHQSNRVCNALALLQCVASHLETRAVFLQANIPLFLYPFLNMNTNSKTRPFEYLRLTSLGVIGALVKTDEKEVINFLLKTEIIPLCLRIMESGTELSKTVATFILQKILLDETGLNYICQTYDRFSHVAMILGKMVIALSKDQSARLLKHVIRCYLRLSDNPRAREALRQCLPDQLKNETFFACLKDDRTTKSWLHQLLKNIETKPEQLMPGSSLSPGPQSGLMGPTSQAGNVQVVNTKKI